ncbi:MAG: hypothetical protein UHP25_11170, partial [Prevotella sp.]|nr:hypothetical protein [Prevotella sp.]
TSRTTVGSDNFHFMAPFLAMTELKRALFCSFGLTKTFFNFNQFPQLRDLKSLIKILDQNALEFLASGKGFIMDRHTARNLN